MRHTACCSLYPLMARLASLLVLIASPMLLAAQEPASASSSLVRIADGDLQIGFDSSGSIRELIHVPDGDNRLAGFEQPFSLWEIDTSIDNKKLTLAPTQAGPPRIEPLSGSRPGLRLVWEKVPLSEERSLGVVVEVTLDAQGSRWTLSVQKPENVELKGVRFPRVPALKPRAQEVLAVPTAMGRLFDDPREMLLRRKYPRRDWTYPGTFSLQCLACYEPGGAGFYAACDDPHSHIKWFTLWIDSQKQLNFEVRHVPEGGAVGASEFRLPFAAVLTAFRGDWMTAAEHYRKSQTAQTIAAQGRLRRGLVSDWVIKTGLWEWNRGRSDEVLTPAIELQKYVEAPVSVFWHWWHDCAYDAGFPEYFPPREGTATFQSALKLAHQDGLHAILYMNQRLWGTTTESWKREGAERYAIKDDRGHVRTESYNRFMDAPCAPMCIGTEFWRNKYAGLAQEALCGLGADGVYMDQAGCSAACYDSNHGHVVGPGRYWFDGLGQLTEMIRRRADAGGQAVLGAEYCSEPLLDDVDVVLSLDVSTTSNVIPFFQAVYHPSVVTFGSYATLVYPPYDERWPAEKKPADRLTLLDRRFSAQFCLTQAKAFVWGMQPTIPNFKAELLSERPEELDYLKRLVHTRMLALKFFLHGTWLRPPVLDVPDREIDIAILGPYSTELTPQKRRCPVVIAGAWRAPDGDVAVALAGINEETLSLQLPIDLQAYGLGQRCSVDYIDSSGRRRLGTIDQADPRLPIELRPRAICVLEFHRTD